MVQRRAERSWFSLRTSSRTQRTKKNEDIHSKRFFFKLLTITDCRRNFPISCRVTPTFALLSGITLDLEHIQDSGVKPDAVFRVQDGPC